ncbi:chromosome segregation protein SMC [Phormidium willei BDU 130791]|nr:chromosome segregation protein SMC [Phormidium willei BDU 130791]
MLNTLSLTGFRGFQQFELSQLGQVNLIVGENNSGKTSILEAIQLLGSHSKLDTLTALMMNRGEYLVRNNFSHDGELDICHLFNGHQLDIGQHFKILGSQDNHLNFFEVTIKREELETAKTLQSEGIFNVCWSSPEAENIKIPLSPENGLPLTSIPHRRRHLSTNHSKTQFIKTSSLTSQAMMALFDNVVLTPDETLLTEALRTIEPNLERIASVSSERIIAESGLSHQGFVARLSNSKQRVPIGSLGDGIWRMLGLTLAIANAKDGILLVDEIDTGLHFTTMSDMWRLIWDAAKRLNVQVFATTHNSDCWQSLAAIANSEHPSPEGITIQRIEKDKPQSVLFTERQVAIAVERGIEVR